MRAMIRVISIKGETAQQQDEAPRPCYRFVLQRGIALGSFSETGQRFEQGARRLDKVKGDFLCPEIASQ